jgi:hypothetical protein
MLSSIHVGFRVAARGGPDEGLVPARGAREHPILSRSFTTFSRNPSVVLVRQLPGELGTETAKVKAPSVSQGR